MLNFFSKPKNIRKKILRTLAVIFGIIFIIWLWIAQPSFSSNKPINLTLETEILKKHVKFISVDSFPRHYTKTKNLNKVAKYIQEHFIKFGCETSMQKHRTGSRDYFNVIGKINPGKGHKIIIGAHYDSHRGTPGADDNASGVAGLIELARLLSKAKLSYEIEIVAYSLEEPPFFATDRMGSVFHANDIKAKGEKIDGVIVLEMIGYFSDESWSQSYPMPLLYLMYPTTGNFITVVGNTSQTGFTKEVKIGMQGSTDLPVYSISAPTIIPGIDFSDHRSYWKHDYNAIMITDTAFYRNKEYHKENDTIDRLDFDRMGKVILSIYNYMISRKF
ncbi:MAG: peptidase M28 [Planctomycetota bacterium]|nr:MAG: peptidase M28 [Planctomycetota bacterium]